MLVHMQLLEKEVKRREEEIDNLTKQKGLLIDELELSLKRLAEKEETVLHLNTMLVRKIMKQKQELHTHTMESSIHIQYAHKHTQTHTHTIHLCVRVGVLET
jgi:hypothetical protein